MVPFWPLKRRTEWNFLDAGRFCCRRSLLNAAGMASPGRCLIGTYSEDSGEIMRKISILAVAAASFALSPLAMAQETDAPAPTEEPAPTRSEEHTSELQSLMRISYAVFCLKKKKKNKQQT